LNNVYSTITVIESYLQGLQTVYLYLDPVLEIANACDAFSVELKIK